MGSSWSSSRIEQPSIRPRSCSSRQLGASYEFQIERPPRSFRLFVCRLRAFHALKWATLPRTDPFLHSFPSLNNSGLQSQSHNVGSSAWQTGPPQNEQAQRQQIPSSRSHVSSRQQQQQPSGGREGFYPTDTYSRNAPMEYSTEQTSQPGRRASQVPSGPPGLVQRPNQQTDTSSADPSRVTSPSGQTQICRYRKYPPLVRALTAFTQLVHRYHKVSARQSGKTDSWGRMEDPMRRSFHRILLHSR